MNGKNNFPPSNKIKSAQNSPMKKICALFSAIILMFSNAFATDANRNSFTVLESNSTKIVLKAEVTGFKLLPVETPQGVQFKAVIDNGTSILEKGAPDLQKLCGSVIVPDHKMMKITSTILSSSTVSNIEIAPSKGNLLRTVDPSTIPFTYSEIYSRNSFYPQSAALLAGDPFIVHDYRGQTVQLNALQYNPTTQELRIIESVIIEITFNESAVVNPLDRIAPLNSVSEAFNLVYKNLFLNYDLVQHQNRYSAITETGRMLIICYDQFMNDMKNFVDWKMQSGMQVDLIAKSAAGTSSTAIKNYVQTYYNAHSDMAYLLLIGDAPQVPSSSIGGNDSDQNYGFLAGSDHYPDIIVGRFSATTSAEVLTQVNRAVSYEKTPSSGTWYKNAVCIGSDQGSANGYNGLADWEFERTIIRVPLLGYNYTSVSELYDGSHGSGDASGNPSASDLSPLINAGVGVINYTGHGNITLIGTTGFNTTDVDALTNTNMFPFLWIVGCQTGNFVSNTCFGEAWARATDNSGNPAGAIGSMVSTINQSWQPPMWAQVEFNNVLTEGSTNIRRTFGGISVCGLAYMNENQPGNTDMTDTWTCFGDPSVMVRTDEPMPMTVSHAMNVYRIAANFTVNCNIEDALVCLYSGNEIQGTGKISGGQATINFVNGNLNGVADDSMMVTVTAYNKIPYQGWVHILDWGTSAPTTGDAGFTIIPNPAVDEITLNFGNDSFSKGTAKIFNTAGQLMKEISFSGTVDQSIDIHNLSAGLYNIEVMLDEKIYHSKVVVR